MWELVLLFSAPFGSQIFDVLSDLVILVSLNAISIYFYSIKCFICIFLCSFHIYKLDNAYIKDVYALRIFMNFIYSGEGRKGV